ncbi:MAG TPA: NAD-dependent epimerase/dehydratase family protein [Candidatus Nanopelagicales bacterium]|nr:NAD-dependent epimerase/dehydratase family protein [Candidatus Nanopelagicales bacterium]
MTILITGIAGGLARRVATRLVERGRAVVGVDYRAAPLLDGVALERASYNKTAIEDVFRRHHPISGVLHLGRIGNLSEQIERRFDLNVIGSRKIRDICLSHRIPALVVLSTFHVYGAHPNNHTPISEEDPLRAGYEFPEIADAIQLDNMASTWIYQHPEIRTVVLRPTNVVGPTIQNTMSKLLRMRRAPVLMGFNPMTQFVQEDDLCAAILAALDGEARGVFNVAGGAALPWRTALELAGTKELPVPGSLAKAYLQRFSAFPAYLLNFLKYPCVISDRAFREATGWAPRVGVREALRSTATAAREG